MLVCFWIFLTSLCYTHIGYLCVVVALVRMRGRNSAQKSRSAVAGPELTVSVVLAAFNEEKSIIERIRNLLESDYPSGLLEVIVVSDGSNDGTVQLIRGLGEPRVKLIEGFNRSGKASCLNSAMGHVRSDITVFTDARQRFEPATIPRLAAAFSDPEVGAVSGALMISPSEGEVAKGVDLYWRLEKALRFAESQWDSCIGCTGAVYGIRTGLYRSIPADTLLDDVVIPMNIAIAGFRVVFDPLAIAWDFRKLAPTSERVRKRRTLAGNFQILFRYPEWVLPGRNRVAWQLVSHKYLRLGGPVFLVGVFASNAALANNQPYGLFLGLQIAFYGAALVGCICRGWRTKPTSAAAGFVFLNWMVVEGFWAFLRKEGTRGWGRPQAHD